MLKSLLYRVLASLEQFRENKLKKKYEKKKELIYSQLKNKRQQRSFTFLKANQSIRKE